MREKRIDKHYEIEKRCSYSVVFGRRTTCLGKKTLNDVVLNKKKKTKNKTQFQLKSMMYFLIYTQTIFAFGDRSQMESANVGALELFADGSFGQHIRPSNLRASSFLDLSDSAAVSDLEHRDPQPCREIRIGSWEGRTGNNVLQLINAIGIAEKIAHQSSFPEVRLVFPRPPTDTFGPGGGLLNSIFNFGSIHECCFFTVHSLVTWLVTYSTLIWILVSLL